MNSKLLKGLGFFATIVGFGRIVKMAKRSSIKDYNKN